MREIPLTNGIVALVDNADFGWLSAFRWHAAEGRRGCFYAQRHWLRAMPDGSVRKSSRDMQRDILDPDMTAPRSRLSDHIDHDTLNNQRYNLRWRDYRGSKLNTRLYLNNTSGFRGVRFDKSKGASPSPWRCQIMSFGVRYIRYHPTAIEAARAYNELAILHHGEDAQLNIIPGD